MVVLGVLADTHIPDRARRLHPAIIPLFREAGVTAILHAGDVSTPGVLDELNRVAPVHAVRGNRDWVALRHLPPACRLQFNGVEIGLTHGHGRWWNYLLDRAYYIRYGLRPERYQPRLLASFPQAKVIVFGHIHWALNFWQGEQLLFNPGSPHFPEKSTLAPSVGLLRIDPAGNVAGQIIRLSKK